MKALSTPLLRGLLLPILLGLLGGCAVYDRAFHPHRLPTPNMTPEAKAKARAAEKARHKGLALKAADPDADAAGTNATDPAAADGKKKALSYSDLPEGTRIKYDKQGLVKTGTLKRLDINRRQLHHYNLHPDKPREASRENRDLRKKGRKNHGKGKAADEPRGKADPADTAPIPAPAPTPPPAPKAKVPVPKPDPTQPAPGNGP